MAVMFRSALLLTVVAAVAGCGSSATKAPAPLAATELPTGDKLKPWSASQPSKPWPQAMVQLGDKVYVALGNLSATDPYLPPAGPGMLVGLVPSTGAQTLIDLGGADGRQCSNPGSVKADGGKLYVSCGGPFGVATGRALIEVDPSGAGSVKRVATIPGDFAPGPVVVVGNRIWVGDGGSDRVLGFDRGTFTADAAPLSLNCGTSFPYVPSMLGVGLDLYVLCAASDGYLVRLDATTGAAKGDKVLVGAQPVALAHTADGRIAVVNSTSGTLSMVTPGTTSMAVAQDVLKFQNSADLEDVRAFDQFLYIVSASTQTLIKVDASTAVPSIRDEVNVNPSGEPNANPTRAEILDENTAVVSDSARGKVIGVRFGLAK